MAGRVPKRFRRPVEREVQRSGIVDIICGAFGLLFIIAMVFGGVSMVYDHLFLTPLEVYYGNASADVPQDLEYFQIPIKYSPNSTIYATAVDLHSDRDINDTIITDEKGFAIYTAEIFDVETDRLYTFTSEDTHKEESFIIHKSEYTTECEVHDRTGGEIEDLNEEIHHYKVSPILK